MDKIVSPTPIAILLATYNGERHIREQIDSLIGQTFQQWTLYIHDDNSNDGTIAIIKEYVSNYPNRIVLLDFPPTYGACQNFLCMLYKVEAKYYMFSDQDDVWLPHKIELEYERMKALESMYSKTPMIVHTNLVVVNEHLEPINNSFWEYERIYPKTVQTYSDYAAVNCVTGCTMLFNEEAKEAIKRPYTNALMHDAWITLSTIAVGGIVYPIEEPTILYRQHGENTLGARDASLLTWKYKIQHLKDVINANIQHYKQMNAIKKISLTRYISSKVRYKINIRNK